MSPRQKTILVAYLTAIPVVVLLGLTAGAVLLVLNLGHNLAILGGLFVGIALEEPVAVTIGKKFKPYFQKV